ncbi:MAG: hypothetical protein ISQ39_02035 [Alphaproteobacteria bacterium]|jgi:hypothetical protein|nr:hypothetical protein [Alphaproteobacteria bacterium]
MLKLNASKTPIVRGKKVYERVTLETLKSKTVAKIDNLLDSIETNDINEILKSNMISKTRNGYKLKVGYGNKNEVLNEDFGGYYDSRDGFAPVKDDLTAIANAITSGEFDSSFESLLNSYRERAEKGKEARRLTLVA